MDKNLSQNLANLNDHLFSALNRISGLEGETLNSETLNLELQRVKAVTSIAGQVTEIARLALESEKLSLEYGAVRPIAPAISPFDRLPARKEPSRLLANN